MKRILKRLACLISWGFLVWFGVVWPQHYSEESILATNIDDPIFGGQWETERHVVKSYFTNDDFHTMKQSQRLSLLVQALNATVSALQMSNISVFLDAGVLLGWYRHAGNMIPWDIDGDVGIIANECLQKYPDQRVLESRIRSVLQPPYVLEYIDCRTDPGRDRSFAGIITDSRNGLKVDIFGFHEVDASADPFSWRKSGSWLQRDLDREQHHKVFPRDSILPLKWGNFSGITGMILPNDPRLALQWDFGFVLDPPILSHGFAMKVHIQPATMIFVITYLLVWGSLETMVFSILSIFLLGGGFRILALLSSVLLTSPAKASRDFAVWMLKIVLLTALMKDLLHQLAPQLFAAFMEALGALNFSVNPHRRCFLYKVLCIET